MPRSSSRRPVLALTQGDPAGIGPEILLKLVSENESPAWRPLLIAELSALEAARDTVPAFPWERLRVLSSLPDRKTLEEDLDGESLLVLDPVAEARRVTPGTSSAADAGGALAALDAGVEAVQKGSADALVTAPLSKFSIARHHLPSFRGHTEYLAEGAGLERYGRDYLMAFLAPDLQVALLSTHLPLAAALRKSAHRPFWTLFGAWTATGVGRSPSPGSIPTPGKGVFWGKTTTGKLRRRYARPGRRASIYTVP